MDKIKSGTQTKENVPYTHTEMFVYVQNKM